MGGPQWKFYLFKERISKMERLSNLAVVSGASSAIGKEVAGILLDQGYSVIVIFRKIEEAGLFQDNKNFIGISADIGDKEQVDLVTNRIDGEFS